jgi:cation:H+ antiporter
MWINTAMLVAGLAALYFGADWLVRGAARLARAFGVSALVIGLTVVALGTSAPELVVSTLAAVRNQPGVAVGNVIGSNIVNVALILGLSAVIAPLRVKPGIVFREMPIMIGAAAALVALGVDGSISRIDAGLLLLGFAGFMFYVLRAGGREAQPELEREFAEFESKEIGNGAPNLVTDGLLVLAGLAALVGGAELLVRAAVAFARAAGVSELTIGLTIVAVGTSLPELATSTVAAFRKEADIAVGNIVGSNIFNVLAILGIAPLIRPIAVDASLYNRDMWMMLGLSLLLPLVARAGYRIGRVKGAVLIASYVGYIALIIR